MIGSGGGKVSVCIVYTQEVIPAIPTQTIAVGRLPCGALDVAIAKRKLKVDC